jgi:large subunit ribosomal protein L24
LLQFSFSKGLVKVVLREKDRVIVEGVNMGTRNIKGDKDRGIPGRSVQIERAMHASNVQLVDPVTGAPTRIMRKILQTGEKVRIAKRSGAIIPRPEILTFRKRPVNSIVTDSDTAEDDTWELTYVPYVAPPLLE